MAKIIIDYRYAVDRNSPEGKAILRELAEIMRHIDSKGAKT